MPKKINMNYLKTMSTTLVRRLSNQNIDLDELFAELDKMGDMAERLQPLTVSQRVGRTIANACMVIFNDMQNTVKVPVDERRAAFMEIISQVRDHLDNEYPHNEGDDVIEIESSTDGDAVEEVSDDDEAEAVEEDEEEEEEEEEQSAALGTLALPTPPSTQVHRRREAKKRSRAQSPVPQEEEGLGERQNAMRMSEEEL